MVIRTKIAAVLAALLSVALFLAIAPSMSARATDIGVTWNNATVPAGVAGLDSIAFGNGVFVGVNGAGYIVRSTDGKTWTLVEQTSTAWNSVAYGGGSFVILGSENGPVFRTSTDDGVTFGAAADTSGLASPIYTALSYGSTTFIALDGDGNCAVAISTDAGQTWADGANSDSCDDYDSSAYGNSTFVSVSSMPSVEYTNDPVSNNWDPVIFGSNIYPLTGDVPSHVTFNGTEFMFVLTDALSGDVFTYTSTDGINWADGVLTSGLPSSEYRGLGWDGSAWLLGAGGNGNGIYRSLDGVNWTEVDANNTEWNAFATGNGIVVAGGDPTSPTGQGLDSTIAIGWSEATVAPTPDVPSADTLAKTGVNGTSELAIAGAAVALMIAAGLLLQRSRRRQND